MAELYEPFSVEFTNWLFQHLHKVFKEKCSKEFIERVIEPECVKKLYSDMFQSSTSETDDLLFETAVIASELDEGTYLIFVTDSKLFFRLNAKNWHTHYNLCVI